MGKILQQAEHALVLEEFLPYRLNRLADHVSREFSRHYKDRHGMTRPEWRVLASLGQFGTATASDIVAHSSQHKTKVSRAVAALEKRGWLTRKTDENDRRTEHLSLTRQGMRAYGELSPLAHAYEAAFMDKVSAKESQAIRAGLAALEHALGLG